MATGSVFVAQAANGPPLTPTAGPLVNTNDAVTVAIFGAQWATVKIDFDGVFNGTVQQEYSTDGVNWLTAPYAKRLDAVSANPSVTANIVNAAAKQTWEVPLPANCVKFRVRQTAGSVAGSITLSGGTLYVPGVPVVATLYDVTEGSIGAGLATGVLDLSGWVVTQIELTTPTTQVWALQPVDDAGAGVGPILSSTAASSGSALIGQNLPAAGATISAGVAAVYPFAGRRFKATLPAGGTVSQGRARISSRR